MTNVSKTIYQFKTYMRISDFVCILKLHILQKKYIISITQQRGVWTSLSSQPQLSVFLIQLLHGGGGVQGSQLIPVV